MKWLIYGGNGWIGSMVCEHLISLNATVVIAKSRADDEVAVASEVVDVKPDRIVSLIGRTSGGDFNTIDYLEQKGKLVENVRDNLYAPFVLATIADKYSIHFTYLGTGCIFNGYSGYNEDSKPDFFGSSYSTVKGFTDRIMHLLPNTLNCRIRMPITNTFHKKNFITKIMNYQKICSVANSMTVLPEMIPIMIDMAINGITGTVNLTNPGVITHNEILEMVREILDPDFTWQNFTIEQQNAILLAERSNNQLDTTLLQSMYPSVSPIKVAVRNVLEEMRSIHS